MFSRNVRWFGSLVCILVIGWCFGVACESPILPNDGAEQERIEATIEGGSTEENASIESSADANEQADASEQTDAQESPRTEDMGPLQEGRPQDIPLLDHTKWIATPPEMDPFRVIWPDAARCEGDFAWHIERDALEVDTGICTFVTLQQPLLASIQRGDSIKLGLWHVQLSSEIAAEAVVELRTGTQTLWSITIPLPARANYLEPRFSAPADAAAGVPLYFHVHNHGANSWYLLYLSVTR